MSRKDCYAKYGCGHIEEDDTLMEVGERSTCSTCQAPSLIVARLIDRERVREIIALLKQKQAECNEAEAKYDEIEARAFIPTAQNESLNRRRYATASQKELLQSLIDKIGWI